MKAKQIQALYDAEKKRPVQKKHGYRKALTVLAAAAVLTAGSMLTVGAVNNWNYSAVFNNFFSEKSHTQTNYDFTGMGLDIGDVVEGDGYTMTIQSLMADASNVYVAYDIALSDEINARIAPYDDTVLTSYLDAVVCADENMLNRNGSDPLPICDDNGIWHCKTVIQLDYGTDLTDAQLKIRNIREKGLASEIVIGYNYDKGCSDDKIYLTAPDFEKVYNLSGITIQPGTTASYNGTLPDDANHHIFDTIIVTPMMIHFESNGTCSTARGPQWDRNWGEDNDVSFTAIYEDGTRKDLILIGSGGGGASAICARNEETNSYDWAISKDYYIASPFSMEGLAAISLNGTEIPMK